MTVDPQRADPRLPSGARYYRCALQVNPRHYASTWRGEASGFDDEDGYVQALLDRAADLGIEILAVTDHNHVGAIDRFREQGRYRGIMVLPGFELSSAEGVHVLCIYETDLPRAALERFLGAFGITHPGASTTSSELGIVQLLAKVREQGGIAIAAHASNGNGLLRTLTGQARIRAWTCDDLLAIQIPGTPDDLPVDLMRIVKRLDPAYVRDFPASEHLSIAVVNAGDVKDPEDLAKPGATCWLKMSRPSLTGLRQAFFDPDTRIRLGAPVALTHPRILGLAWEGGFLDGQALMLNPGLNVLVGGRGSGKSTVIESIRYVFNRSPDTEEVTRSHQAFVKDVLRNGTRISLRLRVELPAPREYHVERIVPNPPVVRDEDGQVLDIDPAALLPGLELFGQHEISSLARDPIRRTRLLHRFLPTDDEATNSRRSVLEQMERNRAEILRIDLQRAAARERIAMLPQIQETLRRYEAAGINLRLQERTLLGREDRLLAMAAERIAGLDELLQPLRDALPLDTAFLNDAALADLPRKDTLILLTPVFQALQDALTLAVAATDTAMAAAHRGIDAVHHQWAPERDRVQGEYERVLRELQKERIDGQEFIGLQRQVDALQGQKDTLDKLEEARADLTRRRAQLVADWERAKSVRLQALDRIAKSVSKRLSPRARVRVEAGDTERIAMLLRDHVSGRLTELLNAVRTRTDISLPALAGWIRSGPTSLAQELGAPFAQARAVCDQGESLALLVEECELSPTTSIELNIAAHDQAPEFRAIERLSTGQTATAILLLILLDPKAPIIIDQPEDDLDNRFISKGIVPSLRAAKPHCQFLVSSHNANIPVLGDADLVIGLEAEGGAGRTIGRLPPEHMGSIDDEAIRALIEQVLEGGRTAFETRRLKYGY